MEEECTCRKWTSHSLVQVWTLEQLQEPDEWWTYTVTKVTIGNSFPLLYEVSQSDQFRLTRRTGHRWTRLWIVIWCFDRSQIFSISIDGMCQLSLGTRSWRPTTTMSSKTVESGGESLFGKNLKRKTGHVVSQVMGSQVVVCVFYCHQDPTWLLWVLKYLSWVQRFRVLSWVEYNGGIVLNSTRLMTVTI